MNKVDFGGTLNANGKGLSGVISGMDTKAIIEGLVAAKQAPLNQAQEDVVSYSQKINAYSELKSKFDNFQDAINNIKNLKFAETGTDTLKGKIADITSDLSEIDNYVQVVVSSSTNIKNFSINVSQVARTHIMTSDSVSSSTDPAVSQDETITINGVDIDFINGFTLEDVADTINAVSDSTNVMATIISADSNSYYLQLESKNTGTANTIDISVPGTFLTSINLATSQSPLDAIFTYNNTIPITRSSNTITDLVDGVTLVLYKGIENATSVDITIDNDVSLAATGIQNFADSYNDLIKFVTQQQQRDENGYLINNDGIGDDDLVSDLITDITAIASKIGLNFTDDFGIQSIEKVAANFATGEPEYHNLLSINQSILQPALLTNFDEIASLFTFNISGNTNDMLVYKRGSGFDNLSFTLTIDLVSDSINADIGGTIVALDFVANNPDDLTQGGTIVGMDGTIFEGYEFYYNGAITSTRTLNISQGIGDKLYNINKILLGLNKNGTTLFDDKINNIATIQNETSQNIALKNIEIEEYRNSLIKKFSRVESAIARANVILNMLDIQIKVMSNNK